MVKKSFTLMEIIIVIVILGLLAVGSFKAIEMLYQRYYQVNTITKFSIFSQSVSDQIGDILYHRVPITAIGYSSSDGDFKQLKDVDSDKYNIFEWISEASDAKKHIGLEGLGYGYSGFIDLDGSSREKLILNAKDFNITDVNDTLNNIFYPNNNQNLNQIVSIIFAGDSDIGVVSSDYNNSYGWHGNEHKKIYLINSFTQVGNDANLTMDDDIIGNKIYSKYYLVDSAWGIALAKDIDKDSNCLNGLNIDDNTLLLFYNYRPWKGETFCADPNNGKSATKAGDVTILARNVTAFKIQDVNNHIEFKIQFSAPLYKGSDKNITITKQKVIF